MEKTIVNIRDRFFLEVSARWRRFYVLPSISISWNANIKLITLCFLWIELYISLYPKWEKN